MKLSTDERTALVALRNYHENRASVYAGRAQDARASRHTRISHQKNAEFHRRAADTLTSTLQVLHSL